MIFPVGGMAELKFCCKVVMSEGSQKRGMDGRPGATGVVGGRRRGATPSSDDRDDSR
jgi:hypothetical protein